MDRPRGIPGNRPAGAFDDLETGISVPAKPRTADDYIELPSGVVRRDKLSFEATPYTDTGNAELLAALFGKQLRFDHRRRRWLLWRRHRWESDRDSYISRLAVEAARVRYTQAENIDDLKERQRVANWAISSESRMRIEAATALARSILPIADSGQDWDRNIWLLGVNNGVVDLKAGELRPGRPDDRITMSTGVDFDPEAKCPRWEQFLTEVFNDAELEDYIWRAYKQKPETNPIATVTEEKINSDKRKQKRLQLHSALWEIVNMIGTAMSTDDNIYTKSKSNCMRLARQTNASDATKKARYIIWSFEYYQRAYLDAASSKNTVSAGIIADNAKIELNRMLDNLLETTK